MRRILPAVVLTFFLSGISHAQLLVNGAPPYNDPVHLVNNVLLGQGVVATNITYTGFATAIGYFNGMNSNLGLDSGILITSGTIQNAMGPNTAAGQTANNNTPGFPLLNQLTTSPTLDAAILQFDFVPISDTIRFGFVFGSEEYPEFVGSSFNDVFGFFISGPNPVGGNYTDYNIAFIPNTTTPITINNVNQNVNTQYYFNNLGGLTVQYDGFTTRIEAVAHVVCNQTYTIKIAIADAGDSSLDSGVFLEGASFRSTGAVVTSVSTSLFADNDTTIYEGCGNAQLTIKLPVPTPTDSVIHFNIGGTAVNGVDYVFLPDSVVILAGQDSVNIFIEAIFDGLNETEETIYLNFPFSSFCAGMMPVDLTLVILNVDSLQIDRKPPDELLCSPDGQRYYYWQASGGVAPLTYTWNVNGQISSGYDLYHEPLQTTTYYVTVSDACLGFHLEDSFTIEILENTSLPQVTLSTYDVFLCEGDTALLVASVTGGALSTSGQWYLNGMPEGNSDSLYIYPMQGQYSYEYVAVDECDQKDSATVNVQVEICDVTVPNVFTPNNDGVNDLFYIENLAYFPGSYFVVYNRWGKKVFESNDYGAQCASINDLGCWDGRDAVTGSDCAEGTYFYVLKIPDGREYNGHVNIFR